MAKPQTSSQRLVDLQNETLKRENEMLTRENTEVRTMFDELKQSLDEAVKTSIQQTNEAELHRRVNSETESDTVDSNAVSEVQEKLKQKDEELNNTGQQMKEAKKKLCDAQERLAVSDQVTVATQRRELQQELQEDRYDKLIKEKLYENLRPEKHRNSTITCRRRDGEMSLSISSSLSSSYSSYSSSSSSSLSSPSFI